MVVRAVVGTCENCGRTAALHTDAIPKWQRRGLRWRLRTIARRLQYERKQ